jgi:hypothetical protein
MKLISKKKTRSLRYFKFRLRLGVPSWPHVRVRLLKVTRRVGAAASESESNSEARARAPIRSQRWR